MAMPPNALAHTGRNRLGYVFLLWLFWSGIQVVAQAPWHPSPEVRQAECKKLYQQLVATRDSRIRAVLLDRVHRYMDIADEKTVSLLAELAVADSNVNVRLSALIDLQLRNVSPAVQTAITKAQLDRSPDIRFAAAHFPSRRTIRQTNTQPFLLPLRFPITTVFIA
jgi:hypothetical protein